MGGSTRNSLGESITSHKQNQAVRAEVKAGAANRVKGEIMTTRIRSSKIAVLSILLVIVGICEFQRKGEMLRGNLIATFNEALTLHRFRSTSKARTALL